jgi:hypothetical protein
VPPSATHDEHDALDTLGVGAGGGEPTMNVVEALLAPALFDTYTLHVPAVPVGG